MTNQKDIAKEVIDYIEANLDEKTDLDTIAQNIGYSKFHLNRIFTAYTGITIYKYLQSRRLTVAAEKLVKTDKPIIQIAYEAGYDSPQSFTFAFRQVYLQPPKIYRNLGTFTPKQDRIFLYRPNHINYYKIKEIAA